MTNTCVKIIGSIFFGVMTLLFVVQGTKYLQYYSYDEGSCLVNNVTYPTSIQDYANLISCDCGQYCKSDTGTCIRVKGVMVDSPDQQEKTFISSVSNHLAKGDCTFAETRCKDGEKLSNRLEAVEKAKHKAMYYVENQNNQTAIPCFYKEGDDNIYLKNDFPLDWFYVIVAFWILSTISLCCCLCKCKCRKSESKSEFV